MSFIPNTYPIFEANQVLTNRHLNDLFNYLDSQERLTRTHLIGVGIVCGWDVTYNSNTVEISRGVGVTSKGYVIKTDELTLTHHKIFADATRPYDYAPFQKKPDKNDTSADKTLMDGIVELTVATDPNKTGLIDENLFKGKALVLYLELRNEGLRNCSPNNCDDKGSEKKATVKALIVPKDFQDNYLQAFNLRIPQAQEIDFFDLKLPRIDVPRTGLTDSRHVLMAFEKAIEEIEQSSGKFLEQVFKRKGNFLGKRLFVQNLYDHLDDLIQALHEYHKKAKALACACSPHEAWFPQHLILGEFNNDGTQFTTKNRTVFIPSPTIDDCEKAEEEAKLLRKRLKLLVDRFEIEPPAKQIRITPTKLGVPLSKKAIPYYYEDFKTLRKAWNYKKTAKGKDHQLLGYHAPDQNDTAPFAQTPLHYDLEPYNFLRIEGHLGQNYQEALKQLLELKSQNRIPIDIIALRAGSFDENVKIDFTKEKCHFEDLEAIYDAFREELRCSLGKTIIKLGNIRIPDGVLAVIPAPVAVPVAAEQPPSRSVSMRTFLGNTIQKVTPQTFFQAFDNDFAPAEKTLGSFMQKTPGVFKDITEIQELRKDKLLFPTLDIGELIANPIFSDPALRTSLSFIDQLATIINLITEDLPELNWSQFQKEHEALKKLKPTSTDGDLKEISEQLSAVITACRLEGLQSIIEEYQRRVIEVKKKQFLSTFLQKHPGIQHKAGVPLGGTFILVYHVESERKKDTGRSDFLNFVKQNDNLPDGAVIADFFLPYMCTSDCAPVQFVLPKNKPTFTFKIESCPDPQNQGFATVSIKPQGGTPGYEVSVNGGMYEALTPRIMGGTNTVIIRDAEGVESIEKTIEIPAEISVDLSQFVWNEREKQTYTQTVIIKGGVSPYMVKFNDIELKDQPNTVEVNGLKNGETYQITITDSNPDTGGCTFIAENFIRACKEPCGGLKTRSHYMLPVQIQQRANKIAVDIISLEVDGQVLVRDKSQDFAPLIKVQDFLKAELNIKKDLWQIAGFKVFNDANDKPQLLGMQIENFDCQQFVLKIKLSENDRTWQLTYTAKGVHIGEIGGHQSKFEIPPFEIQKADLCSANPAFEPIAVEDFKIGYSKERKSAVSLPEDVVKTWYWQKANGERTNEPKATFEVGTVARVTHLLIGFSKRGAVKIETIVV